MVQKPFTNSPITAISLEDLGKKVKNNEIKKEITKRSIKVKIGLMTIIVSLTIWLLFFN